MAKDIDAQTRSEQAASPARSAAEFDAGTRTREASGRAGKLSETQIEDCVDEVLREGFCILKGHFSPQKIAQWKEAFEPILNARIAEGTASGRGANRYYISLPFVPPFADPEVFEDPDILAIVERLGGYDIVMPELATDTPLKDSEYQVIHRDYALLSEHIPELDPSEPFQFGVNFPLVAVTRENGPFEVARGTHRLGDEEAKQKIRSGEMEQHMEPLLMDVGDVMIRDVRTLHRGTPNHTDVPRTMVVVGYNRARHLRPQLKIQMPRATYESLSDKAKHMLRLNPVIESLEAALPEESYSNLYFLEE